MRTISRNKHPIDIFISGGSQHFDMLKALLPMLYPYGRVHLAASFLSQTEIKQLSAWFDVLHEPRHHENGYYNFNLFCIRDIHQLARTPYFIKIDADTLVEQDWIHYVTDWIDNAPDTVLFGPWLGDERISVEFSGPLVQQMFGRELRVNNGRKVVGGFYVGKTAFFQQHHRFVQNLHELTYCFKNGVRARPSLDPASWPADNVSQSEWSMTGEKRHKNLFIRGDEDTLRNLAAHTLNAGNDIHIVDSDGKIKKHPQASVEGVVCSRINVS